METKDQKYQQMKIAVCEFYGVHIDMLYQRSRQSPIPFLKKVVCYFAGKYLKVKQEVIAENLNMKHSNVSIHIKTMKEYLKVSNRIKKEILDIERILSEKAIIDVNVRNSRYYSFVDLNNVVLASKKDNGMDQHIMFVNVAPDEIKKIVDDKWKIEVHENTGKMFFATINKHKNIETLK